MFTIKRFRSSETSLHETALNIRRQVFVSEQGVDPSLEYEHEDESSHYLLLIGGKPIATARWRETEKGIKLERFAVLPAFRNRGIGEILLKAVLTDVSALQEAGKSGKNGVIYLHAQLKAVPFYERNGFRKEGAMFREAGLEHYRMHYQP